MTDFNLNVPFARRKVKRLPWEMFRDYNSLIQQVITLSGGGVQIKDESTMDMAITNLGLDPAVLDHTDLVNICNEIASINEVNGNTGYECSPNAVFRFSTVDGASGMRSEVNILDAMDSWSGRTVDWTATKTGDAKIEYESLPNDSDFPFVQIDYITEASFNEIVAADSLSMGDLVSALDVSIEPGAVEPIAMEVWDVSFASGSLEFIEMAYSTNVRTDPAYTLTRSEFDLGEYDADDVYSFGTQVAVMVYTINSDFIAE